jgi:F0F1-type ATP synthase assembly protein I
LWRSGPTTASYASGVTVQRLLVRQALIAVVVGVVIYLSRGVTSGIGYGIAFYVISTPLAIWAERHRAKRDS